MTLKVGGAPHALPSTSAEVMSTLASRFTSGTVVFMRALQDIEAAILRLPESDRLRLMATLLGSLPPPPDAHTPDEMVAEARRRDAELESGLAQPLSEEQFWAGVRHPRG